MAFLTTYWLGIRVWIWLYLLLSILLFIGVLIYFFRERIRKKYLEIRFPEKLLKVVIHYKGGYYKEFWRLIPIDDYFELEGIRYNYDDKKILKENDWFVRKKGEEKYITVEGKQYSYKKIFGIKNRWKSYPELHYFYNCPVPIKYEMTKKDIEITANQLKQVAENDLFQKLLRLEGEKQIMMILLILGVANALLSLFIVAKMMGWLE